MSNHYYESVLTDKNPQNTYKHFNIGDDLHRKWEFIITPKYVELSAKS